MFFHLTFLLFSICVAAQSDSYNATDCGRAYESLLDIEFLARGGTQYDFAEPGVWSPQTVRHFRQTTPREYAKGSCVLGIIAMNHPSLSEYPPVITARLKSPYVGNDQDPTYADVVQTAGELFDSGIDGQRYTWTSIGLRNASIGIFYYSSRSSLHESLDALQPDRRIADSVPQGYEYLGCHNDYPSNRQLTKLSWAGANLSIERCARYCHNYDFFGVESGRECYCGNDLGGEPSPMHHAPDPAIGGDEACNVTCNGNESQSCGGVGVMSVYGQNQD